jgi:hypothetical protein
LTSLMRWAVNGFIAKGSTTCQLAPAEMKVRRPFCLSTEQCKLASCMNACVRRRNLRTRAMKIQQSHTIFPLTISEDTTLQFRLPFPSFRLLFLRFAIFFFPSRFRLTTFNICLLNGTGRCPTMASSMCSASASSWADTKCCGTLQVFHSGK